ncbi:MAG: hypothetical protein KAR07_11210 [Spirochaetes bacterium]|nr:hypothetical protein [Spirochaetota bacterium]
MSAIDFKAGIYDPGINKNSGYALSRKSKGNVEKDSKLAKIDKAFLKYFPSELNLKVGSGKV